MRAMVCLLVCAACRSEDKVDLVDKADDMDAVNPSTDTEETPAPDTDPPGTDSPDTDEPVDTGPADPDELPAARIFINEVCSSNRHGLQDDQGRRPDWIELYNPGPEDFPLGGLTISDDDDEPALHTLDPSLVVPAGGWLVLYADGRPEEGPAHLSFELGSDGDEVGLYAGGTVLSRLEFGPLLPDSAMARVEDGGEAFAVTLSPTPGASNGAPAQTPGPVEAEPMGLCEPLLSVADAEILEGETLNMTLSCATGVDPTWLAPSLLTRTDDLSLQGTEISWSTGPDDAGTVEVLMVIENPGLPGVPETVRATAWVYDDWDNPDNVQPDPAIYTREFGLPVLHLDPAGAVTQQYTSMTAWYDGQQYTGTIKIRGDTSASYAKSSYTLEFEPEQIDLDEVGLGNKDHLVLISSFDDSSYVRQKLIFDTWAEQAAWSGQQRLTPRTAFLVVYLDGEYHGLYIAIDHIDDEFIKEMGLDPSGNLFKAVDHDANYYRTDRDGQPKLTLHDGWEKKEGSPASDYSDIDDLTAFSADSDHATFDAELDNWLIREEFMDWFLLVHWFNAADSGGRNVYLYRDPATGLFRYTPWDFNSSLGQNWYTGRTGTRSYNDFIWTNGIFWHFQDDPVMADALWTRFADQRAPGGPFDPMVLQSKLDAYYALIEPSAERDWQRWEADYWATFGWARSDQNDFQAEFAYVEDWIVERAAYMDDRHP